MIIDTHTHVWSFPSYRDLSQHIKTTEDLIAFRTRYPELYNCSLTEEPVDNSDALIADMDKNGAALTLVQARPGYVANDQVAQAAARHSDRLQAIARVGHDQPIEIAQCRSLWRLALEHIELTAKNQDLCLTPRAGPQ